MVLNAKISDPKYMCPNDADVELYSVELDQKEQSELGLH